MNLATALKQSSNARDLKSAFIHASAALAILSDELEAADAPYSMPESEYVKLLELREETLNLINRLNGSALAAAFPLNPTPAVRPVLVGK
jgi:hypothetical protein